MRTTTIKVQGTTYAARLEDAKKDEFCGLTIHQRAEKATEVIIGILPTERAGRRHVRIPCCAECAKRARRAMFAQMLAGSLS